MGRPLWRYLVDPFGDRDFGPMWFVVTLLAFSLLYAARPLSHVRVGARLGVAVAVAVTDFVVWLRWSYAADTVWNLNWTHGPRPSACSCWAPSSA